MSDTTAITAAASAPDGSATPAVGTTTPSPSGSPSGTSPETATDDLPTEQHDIAIDDQGDGGTDDLTQWKRHAREWERRAKRNAELAARYPDLESRTAELQQQYEDALGARARIEAELWRERAARAHGIPDDLLDLLTGASETEVAERAERIAAQLTTARRPLPDPTQGRGTPPPTSPADTFAAYLRGALNR